MAGAKGAYSEMASKSPGVVWIVGSFTTAGTSAPSVVAGSGFTVAAPSTGVYTITLTDGPHPGVYAAVCSLEDATADANDTVRFGDVDAVATAGTFTIITASAAGTDADLTGPVVHFMLAVRNTVRTR